MKATLACQEEQGAPEDVRDISHDVKTQPASAKLQEAAAVVAQHVNKLSQRVQRHLSLEDR